MNLTDALDASHHLAVLAADESAPLRRARRCRVCARPWARLCGGRCAACRAWYTLHQSERPYVLDGRRERRGQLALFDWRAVDAEVAGECPAP